MDLCACVHVLGNFIEAVGSANATNAANKDAILAFFGVFFLADFFLAEDTGVSLFSSENKLIHNNPTA